MSVEKIKSGFTEEVVENTEKALLNQYIKGSLYVLVDTINGAYVHAVFISRTEAIRYMIRTGTNFCVGTYSSMLEDMKEEGDNTTPPDFLDYTKEFIADHFKIHEIDHIDVSKPIYKIQNYNYMVHGEPSEYLTNSKEVWRSKQPNRNRWSDQVFGEVLSAIGGSTCESDGWMKDCKVKVDPELPELEVDELEE
jgi:hypothetical protein